MKAETRPRPLAREQDSLCSSPSGLLSLPSRTELPETLKRRTGPVSTQAPMPARQAHENPFGSSSQQDSLRPRRASRCPFGQRKNTARLHPSESVCRSRPKSKARAKKPSPASCSEQRSSPLFVQPAPQDPSSDQPLNTAHQSLARSQHTKGPLSLAPTLPSVSHLC